MELLNGYDKNMHVLSLFRSVFCLCNRLLRISFRELVLEVRRLLVFQALCDSAMEAWSLCFDSLCMGFTKLVLVLAFLYLLASVILSLLSLIVHLKFWTLLPLRVGRCPVCC